MAQKAAPDSPGFGAYGAAATALPDLTMAVDKMPESKINGSLDFTESDKRWLKDLGITTTDPNSFHKVWESDTERNNSKHRTWANTYGGRLGMRAVSRGIVGAAFYAAGNIYAGEKMASYSPNEKPENVLQFIAKCIDKTAGKAIKTTVKGLSNEAAAERAVTFRDTVQYSGYHGAKGRSLGHEVMGVTFDFASMSFGDYMTRYALGVIDPNAKKHWIKDGHLDVPGGLKDLLYNVFRGVTYAAGEDMAVAIPYVFGMRLQGNIIDKASPGARYDLHRNLNGGSFKVKDGKIVGDYQLEGMTDLAGRFSWYNVGTKMFRDAYSEVQAGVEHFHDRWKAGDHSLPHLAPDPKSLTPSGLKHAAATAARYVARTTTKVMAYMLPATFFFYSIRSPQSKTRGLAIDADYGVLGRDVAESTHAGLHASAVQSGEGYERNAGSGKDHASEGVSGRFKAFKPGSRQANDFHERMPDGSVRLKDPSELNMYYLNDKGEKHYTSEYPFLNKRTDVFTKKLYQGEKGAPWYSKVTDPIGMASHKAGSLVENLLDRSGIASFGRKAKLDPETIAKRSEQIEDFSRIFANASLAYTPYFMAKTDVLAAEWDTKRTDMALDRTLDGAGHLNWGEFRAGIGEVLRAMMREPFTDPAREEMAQRLRWRADPEHQSNEAYQLSGERGHASRFAPGRKSPYADEGLKAKKITPETLTQLKPRETSWTAQEALRQFQETAPQGQSVH